MRIVNFRDSRSEYEMLENIRVFQILISERSELRFGIRMLKIVDFVTYRHIWVVNNTDICLVFLKGWKGYKSFRRILIYLRHKYLCLFRAC